LQNLSYEISLVQSGKILLFGSTVIGPTFAFIHSMVNKIRSMRWVCFIY